MSGDHGAEFIDMVGAIEADAGVAGQEHGGGVSGTNNVAVRNQLLGMQLVYSRYVKTTWRSKQRSM